MQGKTTRLPVACSCSPQNSLKLWNQSLKGMLRTVLRSSLPQNPGLLRKARRCPTVCHVTSSTPSTVSQQAPSSRIFFADFPLDKLDKPISDDTYEKYLVHKHARLIPVKDACALVKSISTSENGNREGVCELISCQPKQSFDSFIDASLPPVLMGLQQGAPVFAAEIKAEEADALAEQFGAVWEPVRSKGWRLSGSDAALAATACGIVGWHRRNLFCSASGERTLPCEGGCARFSPATQSYIYPRIDPAVIMLVTCGEFVLLGRNRKWQDPRYSLLSGFVEMGETLEGAVSREVFEESGVQVDSGTIAYTESQPWPFPQSLMVGFKVTAVLPPAEARGRDLLGPAAKKAAIDSKIRPEEIDRYLGSPLPDIRAQAAEMADVRWIHAECVRDVMSQPMGALGFRLPRAYTLAARMIAAWAKDAESSTGSAELDAIPSCWIGQGRFKYVLIRVTDNKGHSKLIVRGISRASYHMDVFQRAKVECRGSELEPLGGGRIEHYREQQVVAIYGYSVAFGPAVHEVTAEIVRRSYPLYDPSAITVSYDGY